MNVELLVLNEWICCFMAQGFMVWRRSEI